MGRVALDIEAILTGIGELAIQLKKSHGSGTQGTDGPFYLSPRFVDATTIGGGHETCTCRQRRDGLGFVGHGIARVFDAYFVAGGGRGEIAGWPHHDDLEVGATDEYFMICFRT